MKFIVHVVDEVSKFIFSDGQYALDQAISENQEPCDMQRSDCFYSVEAQEATEAVVDVAQRIKILDENDCPVNLAFKIAENYKKLQSAEIGPEGSALLDPLNLVVSNATFSNLTTTVCQVRRNGEHGDWLENHKIFFYVSPVNRIIDLKG